MVTVVDWLILQVPYAAVFEGEPLVMRCRGWYDKMVYKLHYYHDGKAVRYFPSSANYTVPQARASDSGRYQCSGTMRIPVESAPMFSAKAAVTVQGGNTWGPGREAIERWKILGREPRRAGRKEVQVAAARQISPRAHGSFRLSSAVKAPLLLSLRGDECPYLPAHLRLLTPGGTPYRGQLDPSPRQKGRQGSGSLY